MIVKYDLSCLCLGILGCVCFSSTTVAKQPPTESLVKPLPWGIGNIKYVEEIGGSCALTRRGKQGYVFWSTDAKFALMNINGKDRTLQLIRETAPQQTEKKGDRSTRIYKTGKIIVQIDRVVARTCRVGELDCSTTSYDGKMKLSIGDRQQIISVEGFCGS
jgi:hypothetical protein